jgi:hypothetical protein
MPSWAVAYLSSALILRLSALQTDARVSSVHPLCLERDGFLKLRCCTCIRDGDLLHLHLHEHLVILAEGEFALQQPSSAV